MKLKFLSYCIIRVLRKNRISRRSRSTTYICNIYLRFICIKELAYAMVGAAGGRSEIHKTGWQARNSGRFSKLRNWEFLLPSKPQILFLKPSTDWLSPPTLSVVIYLKSTDFNINHIYKIQHYLD